MWNLLRLLLVLGIVLAAVGVAAFGFTAARESAGTSRALGLQGCVPSEEPCAPDPEGPAPRKRSPWGLLLQDTEGGEARLASVGDTLTVVGWSPRSRRGEGFQLCVGRLDGVECRSSSEYVLGGTVHTLATWTIAPAERRRGVFKLSLRVQGEVQASDTVRVR